MKYYIIDKISDDYLNQGEPFTELFDLEQYLQELTGTADNYQAILDKNDWCIKVVSEDGEIISDDDYAMVDDVIKD